MNVNIELSSENSKKNIFSLKSTRKDGLVLQLHYAVKNQNVRFTQACFNGTGQILLCITHKGDIFIVNFTLSKFWFLMNICSCTVLCFSLSRTESEIIVGISSGELYIIDIGQAKIINKLIGHKYPVTEVSFSTDYLCVTSSVSEAIVWDLRNYSKIQVLTLSHNAILKHVMFMPITNNILASFQDHSIYVWKYGSFELIKQIMPAFWNKFLVNSITFTKNGRAMALAGHSLKLAIFLTDSWELAKTITLPNTIKSVKKLDFISQPFDGGSNRVLSILSSNGVLYLYDMQSDALLSHISLDVNIQKFHASPDGKYIACILSSGLVQTYNLSPYLSVKHPPSHVLREGAKFDSKSKIQLQQQAQQSVISAVNEKLRNVLDKKKLYAILKEYGQYPDMYRLKIWIHLLELPNNKEQYNTAINHVNQSLFENLGKDHPIEDKMAFKNLKKLLTNLVMWCPFFAEVDYLPVFVFPFVKVFKNEPVLCFEAVCTITVNWCQHWFEYYPLPPVNTLAMIENGLLEYDPEVLSHLNACGVTSKIYAWPLLETVFSEVLMSHDWLILWDHILSNEPSYLLMAVVAYTIIFRGVLLKLSSDTDFHAFYHNQNLIDLKKLVEKSYELLEGISSKNHPRQYLNYFKKLELGPYPKFADYPKAVLTYQSSSRELKHTSQLLHSAENQILELQRNEIGKLKEIKIGLEENLRLAELEKLCELRLSQEREQIESQRRKLEELKKQVYDEEIEILTLSRDVLKQKSSMEKQKQLKSTLMETERKQSLRDLSLMKAEGEVIRHYADLLKQKQQIEELLNSQRYEFTTPEHGLLLEQQEKLKEEIEKVKSVSQSKQHMKQLNIATGLTTMDSMIKKIENKLESQTTAKDEGLSHKTSNMRRIQLETVELELEVKKLLQLLDFVKSSKYSDSTDDFHLLKVAMEKMKKECKAPASSPM